MKDTKYLGIIEIEEANTYTHASIEGGLYYEMVITNTGGFTIGNGFESLEDLYEHLVLKYIKEMGESLC